MTLSHLRLVSSFLASYIRAMKRTHRLLAFLLSLALFLTLGPLLVLYAMGYRWGVRSGATQEVGVLLVESVPRRAIVAVNGRVRGATPQAVSNLPPGSATLEVTAAGYQGYRKQLNILPGQVTESRTIRLIPEQLTAHMLADGVQRFSLAPNRRALAVVKNNVIRVIDTDGAIIMPPRTIQPAGALLWSPDSTYLLMQHPAGAASAVNLAEGTVQALQVLSHAVDIVWDPRVPARLLALLSDGRLLAYHVAAGKSEVIADSITAFAVSSRSIYVIDTAMQLHQLTLQAEEVAVHALPPVPAVTLLRVTPAGRVAIQFEDGQLAVLTDHNELLPVAQKIQSAGWSPDGQLLYLQTDPSSVYVYNVADERHGSIPIGQQQLVVRLSRPIHDIQWFAGGGHLIFQVDDELVLAEIDTRDHVRTYTLDSTNLGESQTEVGEEGRQLFYLKNNGGSTALVSLMLTASPVDRTYGIGSK
ncbi:MAG: hypothetical protein COT71_03975 [Candidatus Andersenbacteria bacterium CG10_big_fil_rev_8_21_14_0_10_54_11]|uniref:PEGA domain-containing protein n=1 Tax=Candidatus Andersenbacteria bacterium CG10_big_fil_rev_8_21_14_0_10_54_11 TaxID=1974485 RepID=A0A2M6WYH6_9BACT|nr:MAG: hypothetical protein COT71_03975 [Candidatus Andersenbacteria bacterium CG10_big_fil_rev_8_21_14_0_10_54_11]